MIQFLGRCPVVRCWLNRAASAALLVPVLLAAVGCNSKPAHPNVMLVVLDTTRADHLGVYGYSRKTSPELDAFARENVMFSNAVTVAPWTPPSVATMITGLYPTTHGVMPPNSREKAIQVAHRLSDNLETLAEFFKAHGYKTGGVTPNPWTKEEFNYNQGYDIYRFKERAIGGDITTEAISILDEVRKDGEPFFLYVHYLDPHDPYKPPAKYNTFSGQPEGEQYDEKTLPDVNLYDGEISYMDACFGKLIAALKERGLYDDMRIVVLGDHGEQLRERGDMGHGFKLHAEELHVPLFVRSGQEARTVDFTVSTLDVFPTIIEMAKFDIPSYAQGISLLNDENSRDRFGVLSEIRRKYNQRSITTFEGKKLIMEFPDVEYTGADIAKISGVGLFDRTVDPKERSSIEDPATTKALLGEFDKLYRKIAPQSAKTNETVEVSDETVKQLKSLGYIQ